MTGPRVRYLLPLLGLCVLVAIPSRPVSACPFCGMSGQTLTQEVDQAALVIYGKMKNPRLNPDGGGTGVTDLELDPQHGLIKSHPFVADKKVVVIPRYVPAQDDGSRYLIFGDIFKGKLDPYRGLPVSGEDMPRYLKGAQAVKEKKVPERLKFFLNWLQNRDAEIATDALKEFGNASYEDFRAMTDSIQPEQIAKWLEDPETPGFRIGLYASMLGHSSKTPAEHAKLLRKLIENPEKQVAGGIDGIIAGQVLLEKKEGWEYLRNILANRKKEFPLRYAALKAARFFYEFRPDVITKEEVIKAVSLLLEHGDMADLGIEDLRKWKAWGYTKEVLDLKDRPTHDLPIIRRAILRFALSCPLPAAKVHVAQMRKVDEDLVKSTEELLKSEQSSTPETRAPGAN